MKTKSLTFLLSLTFLFLFSGSVFADDFQDAVDAYKRKDYKTAYKLFLPLAEQGDADAQYMLGFMYLRGDGVSQDYQEAVKWYRLSAEQGVRGARAQFHLGTFYEEGLGVPQDYVLAHMWYNLSSSNGYKKSALINRNILEEKMSKQQIEKAQELARNWKPRVKKKSIFEQLRETWDKVTK